MVPRKVARIREYVANRVPSPPGSNQAAPRLSSTVLTSGTGSPASKVSSLSRAYRLGLPSNRERRDLLDHDVVTAANVGPSGGVIGGRPSDCHCRARKITCTASAVSLSQY